MTIKEGIEEIPNLIKILKEKFTEKAEQKFMDAKLKDGTIISYDGEMPAVGMPLFVVDETGNRLPAPDGEHELEDGTVYVVSGGMIVEIKPTEAAPAAEEGMEGEAKPQGQSNGITEAQAKSIIESVIKETVFSNAEYVEKFKAIEKENSDLKAEVEKLSVLLKDTFSLVEKIAGEPSEKPKEKNDGFMTMEKALSDRDKEKAEFRKKYLPN